MIDLLTGWPLFVGLLAIIAVLVVQIPFEDVKRGRVERFARREALPITVGNGPVVIRYLATTRRWRGTGLLTAFALAILLPLVRSDGQIRIEEVWAFIGWFVGAVIA